MSNAKKLQADAEATRRQLEQEKQTVAKVQVQAATTYQQLEQERDRELEKLKADVEAAHVGRLRLPCPSGKCETTAAPCARSKCSAPSVTTTTITLSSTTTTTVSSSTVTTTVPSSTATTAATSHEAIGHQRAHLTHVLVCECVDTASASSPTL